MKSLCRNRWALLRSVVRGGSFYDPPRRAGSSWRHAYPEWLRAFNVGFRPLLSEPIAETTPERPQPTAVDAK